MHTKSPFVSIITIALVCFFTLPAMAQYRHDRERERKENEKEDPKTFKSKLWYGGGINIGFGAYQGFSSFNFGLSPMVGYKITKSLSAGPRVAFDFTSLKQRGVKSLGLTSIDVGAFVRFRAFQGLFLQGELSNEWYQDLDYLSGEKYSDTRVNQRLGAGWNFGSPGGAGTEICVLYNFRVAQDLNTWRNPIEYRLGFTWKF